MPPVIPKSGALRCARTLGRFTFGLFGIGGHFTILTDCSRTARINC
jgi:hypothetical protein